METEISREAAVRARLRMLEGSKSFWKAKLKVARCKEQERCVKECEAVIASRQREIDALVDELAVLKKFAAKFNWDLERNMVFVEEDSKAGGRQR